MHGQLQTLRSALSFSLYEVRIWMYLRFQMIHCASFHVQIQREGFPAQDFTAQAPWILIPVFPKYMEAVEWNSEVHGSSGFTVPNPLILLACCVNTPIGTNRFCVLCVICEHEGVSCERGLGACWAQILHASQQSLKRLFAVQLKLPPSKSQISEVWTQLDHSWTSPWEDHSGLISVTKCMSGDRFPSMLLDPPLLPLEEGRSRSGPNSCGFGLSASALIWNSALHLLHTSLCLRSLILQSLDQKRGHLEVSETPIPLCFCFFFVFFFLFLKTGTRVLSPLREWPKALKHRPASEEKCAVQNSTPKRQERRPVLSLRFAQKYDERYTFTFESDNFPCIIINKDLCANDWKWMCLLPTAFGETLFSMRSCCEGKQKYKTTNMATPIC